MLHIYNFISLVIQFIYQFIGIFVILLWQFIKYIDLAHIHKVCIIIHCETSLEKTENTIKFTIFKYQKSKKTVPLGYDLSIARQPTV